MLLIRLLPLGVFAEDVVSSGYSDLGCYWYDEVNDTTFNDNFGILTSSPLNEVSMLVVSFQQQ